MRCKRVLDLLLSGMPLIIVGGLLYAGLFVKPQPHGSAVAQPVFERGEGFYGLASPADGKVWTVGSNGKIVYSDNGGDTWILQKAPLDVALQDISAWDVRQAVAVGNDGIVLRTTDGGHLWQSVQVPTSKIANKLLRVKTLPGGVAWAVGEGGSVLHSTDFGTTWRQAGAEDDTAWNDIFFVDGRGWLVGEFGRIQMTTDGGASWRQLPKLVKSSLMSVAFKDANNGIAVGLGGVILVSRDGGQTWTQAKSPESEHLFNVIWDGNRWLAVGAKGVVLVGDSEGSEWKLNRLTELDRNWYMAIAKHGEKYYLAGSRVVPDATLAR